MAVDGMSSIRQLPSNFNQYPQTSTSTLCIWGGWWCHDRYFTSGKTVQKMCVAMVKRWKAFQHVLRYYM